MTRTVKAVFVLIGMFCVLNSFMPQNNSGKVLAEESEVKAVWAATVFSLDFPQNATTDSDVLKRDIDSMIKKVKEMGYNTLFFQVRPASDAFYDSEIFPWSVYLTGEQGIAPQDDFDPLGYAVDKAHEEGISLHAWINPYRVTATAPEKDKLSGESVVHKYPELIAEHSDGKLYLNPGVPETNDLVVNGVLEIIRNYDVDGIHIDDYFYPGSNFPDGETFAKYGQDFSDIEDWRRNNITSLIQKLRDAIKSENDDIIFSVSPCGIWANKDTHPQGSDTNGKQAYFEYYADTKLWVQENMVDWIIPQIYWNIGYELADFEILANWWNKIAEGTDVKVCIGQAVYKAADETVAESVWYGESGAEELKRQTELVRNLENVCGYAHYRLGSLKDNKLLSEYATEINLNSEKLFNDTDAYPWAEEAIVSLYEKGIVNGMGDGSFGCSRAVNRADFMVMLMRMLDKENAPFDENFSDITEDKYYYNAIGAAKALGYTDGRGDNIFDPTGNISRQDMAVMAYRVLKKENLIKDSNASMLKEKFSDAEEISGYAREAVAAMTESELLSGYETGEFKPSGSATRAETAVFMNRIMNILDKK